MKKFKLSSVIKYLESTSENSWCVDVVRTKDNSKNCMFGHLFAMGDDEKESNELWDWFENCVTTTYAVYPINDGEHPDYQQPTPKQRCIAYLKNIELGKELTTYEAMELEYQAYKKAIK